MSTIKGLMRVADEESQWANGRMGRQEDIQVVRVHVGQEQAAVTQALVATTQKYSYLPT